jgi:hypothetical protein
MLIPRCKITFQKENGNEYVIDFVTEIEIEESFEHLTDTFKLTFPRALNFKGQNLFNGSSPVFERGDQVKVELGYFPKMRTVFTGWIAEIGANIPVEIKCEDDMFLLKNTRVSYPDKANINYSYVSKKNGKRLKHPKVISPQITLRQLLYNILPDDIDFECLDVNLGMFRASNVSVAKILEELNEKYGLYTRFRDRKLYVGFQSNAGDTVIEEFEFERNIINSDDLQFQRKEDISIKVVVVSIDLNNVKTEVEVGDSDGAQRTFHMYNATEASMREYANLKLTEVKYTGYTGTFETFGEPYVRPGDIAKLVSKKLPERNGLYIIPSVKRNFGMNGYKSTIQIGEVQ